MVSVRLTMLCVCLSVCLSVYLSVCPHVADSLVSSGCCLVMSWLLQVLFAVQPYQKGQVVDLLGSRGIQQPFDGQLRHIQVAWSLLLTHFAAQAHTIAVF